MKKVFSIISVFIVIILIAALSVLVLSKCNGNSGVGFKQEIIEIVQENQEILVEAVISGNYEEVSNIKGIKEITVNEDYTIFYCEGKGIAPSSQEYGFYYSKSNLPMAVFDGKPVFYFEEDIGIGEGKNYTDDSYNSFYTEKITELFYYYDNNL